MISNSKGKHWKLSEETKKRQGLCKLGENNPQWKGDDVGVGPSLHEWVRNHLPMPELCEDCKKVPPYDLANVTEIYTRAFKNWKYLCRKCHMTNDGRMKNLKQYRS